MLANVAAKEIRLGWNGLLLGSRQRSYRKRKSRRNRLERSETLVKRDTADRLVKESLKRGRTRALYGHFPNLLGSSRVLSMRE